MRQRPSRNGGITFSLSAESEPAVRVLERGSVEGKPCQSRPLMRAAVLMVLCRIAGRSERLGGQANARAVGIVVVFQGNL